MKSFQLDPGTVKVDWALDGPIPWAAAPVHPTGTFHVADPVEDMAETLGQVSARAIPARPFMLAGQMTTTDRTRSPSGTESLWAYTHVPQDAIRDAGEEGIAGSWDHDDCQRFADRMQKRIERLAPGFGRGSCPAESWARVSSSRATPASPAAPSTVERRSCIRSTSFAPSPGSGEPRLRSAVCTSARRQRTPEGVSTEPPA